MNHSTTVGLAWIGLVVLLVAYFALLGGVAYVAWHFISKFW